MTCIFTSYAQPPTSPLNLSEQQQKEYIRTDLDTLVFNTQVIRDVGEHLINMSDEDLKTMLEIQDLEEEERAKRLSNNNELSRKYDTFMRRYNTLLRAIRSNLLDNTEASDASHYSVPYYDALNEYWNLWAEIETTLQVKSGEVSNSFEDQKANLEESRRI